MSAEPRIHWIGSARQPVVALLLLATSVVACEAAPAKPEVTPAVPAPVVDSPGDLGNEIRLRTAWGLRADEAWIRQVAADPAAVANAKLFEIPVTNEERAKLERRTHNIESVRGVMLRYGEDQPEWAGLFIDQDAGGAVVGLFVDGLSEHRRELRKRLAAWLRWDVRQARWTVGQLAMFSQQVAAEEAWFRTIDAWFLSADPDISGNTVRIQVSSANPAAVRLVLEHFGNPDWMDVESDGIGRWEGPRGAIVVTALTEDGRPVADLDCRAIPDVPSAAFESGTGVVTSDRGICRIQDVAATTFTVELVGPWTPTGERMVVGRGRVTVPANGEGRVRIVVED